MHSATLEVFAVVVLSSCGFFKQLRKMQFGNRLMVKRDILFWYESWQMSRCIHNAYISLLEILKWNADRIIGVPNVTTFRGCLALNVSGHIMIAAVVKLVDFISFSHQTFNFFALCTIRESTPLGSQIICG